MIDLFDYILQRYVNSLGSSESSAECRVLLNILNEDGIEIPTDRPRTLFMLLYYLSTLNDATVINAIKSKIDFETISDWDMQDALSIILENKNPSYSWNKTEITKFLINMSDIIENRDSIKSYLILSGYTNAICDVDELKFQENRKNVIGVYLYKPALKNTMLYAIANNNIDYSKKIISNGKANGKNLTFTNTNVSNVMGCEINAAKKLSHTIINRITIGTIFNCNRFSDNVKLLEKMINESKKEVNDNV